MKFSVKSFLPRTLFGRSLMILVTPILLIQIITTFVFFDRHWGRVTNRLSFAVAGEMAVIADQIEQGGDEDQIKQIAGYAARNLDLLISYETDGALPVLPEGNTEKQHSLIVRPLARAMEAQIRRPSHIDVNVQEKWVEVSIKLENGILHVSLPQKRLFSSSSYIFLLWMIGVSLALLAIAILFMRNQIRPIRRLAVAAERFGRGLDIHPSFKPEGAREIRQASGAFLEMHERIRRQIQQRTAMLSGVSHDLRTPLTRMKLQVAMLEQTPDVEALKGDIEDMERMIDAYLDFARGEGGEQSVRTDLNDMLERVAVNARRQGGEIDFQGGEGNLSVQLRPIAFERCLSNIVSNARKYSEHSWLAAVRRADVIEVTLDDDGPGIPEDQFEEVFKPFVRVDASRNPATGGVGLGLPIAQDVVHSHGGRIWLEDSNHGGLRVVIHLPV